MNEMTQMKLRKGLCSAESFGTEAYTQKIREHYKAQSTVTELTEYRFFSLREAEL